VSTGGPPRRRSKSAIACHIRRFTPDYPAPMRITVLSGGIGGARFLTGLKDATDPASDTITVIGNTADDIWLFGLRVCPDLDTVMYTLGGGIAPDRGWGRADETWHAKEELAAYGVEPTWFGLGDRDLATHIVRTQMLQAGYPLSEITEALCNRWQPGVRLLPMTDDRVETHVVIADTSAEGGRRAVHFQEYWVRLHGPVAYDVVPVGAKDASPAPGVVAAITEADVVVLPPSNPVVSIGTILAVPGIEDALRDTTATVIGVSPIIGGAPVRGMADRLLPVIGVDVAAAAVARHYGARSSGGLIDGWLVDIADRAAVDALEPHGISVVARPLLMRDPRATKDIAQASLDLASQVQR
jgi:LPPG:FO 2-phospho-L-lactate transferase